eukprot:849405-Pleurochrysis_carterae.AAC.3
MKTNGSKCFATVLLPCKLCESMKTTQHAFLRQVRFLLDIRSVSFLRSLQHGAKLHTADTRTPQTSAHLVDLFILHFASVMATANLCRR